jgi:hypothetical protein
MGGRWLMMNLQPMVIKEKVKKEIEETADSAIMMAYTLNDGYCTCMDWRWHKLT